MVELASNTAEALAADDAPTITFPLLVIAPVVKLAIVPTLVKLEPVTVAFNVVPVNVPASAEAVMSIFALPSNAIPFIVLAVANLVAVPALPVVVVAVPAVVAVVAVAAFPVVF